jgi:SAM-dependent methyltransferase
MKAKFQEFGYDSIDEFFMKALIEAYDNSGQSPRRFISLGAGNCDAEARFAKNLVASGRDDFVFECLELNQEMLTRGEAFANEMAVAANIRFIRGDFNKWKPSGHYDAVTANQSLHHVLNLENLFDSVKIAIDPSGLFIVSDTIGCNGHKRWPETLEMVHKFWEELPTPYRYNLILERQEKKYINWDCSTNGFEGIRSQDILPLLIERFHFESFFAFGSMIDPFVDRAFGHHFDPEKEWDRNFIDRIHEADEQGILSGKLKPTHMLAVMSLQPVSQTKVVAQLTPEFCVRRLDPA